VGVYKTVRAELPHVADTSVRKMRSVMKGPAKKDLSVWADRFSDRYGDALPGAVTRSEREKIPLFLSALQERMSWNDAAEFADFRSGDTTVCPPSKMARIVVMSFLESQTDGKDLLRQLEALHPESEPSPLVIHPSWEKECEQKHDFGGRVRSMVTDNADLIAITHDNDLNVPICKVSSSVSDAKLHQQALDKVTDALIKGDLNLFEFAAAQKAGIKVEPNASGGKYLLCLHTHSESRVYGVYDKKTGTITWRGLVDSHRKWTQFIKQFKL
jgi:hypothetical protein